jgi:SAM-dependent methyltransferase
MSYQGLKAVASAAEEHLGGNIREGDPFTFSPTVWKYITDRFAVKSVLDLGSGLGYSANYFYRLGMQVVAVDGLRENVAGAIYPTLKFDLAIGAVECNVDLVHCQEVVEHIDEAHLENLLRSLACGKFVLMTHALPGQGGYHHVNEKPTEYWVGHMARHNCVVLEEDTKRIRRLASEDGALFLARTGMLFANKAR